jgi:hypothetical protein
MESEVYKYILQEEATYQTVPITVVEGYEWSMYEHCRRTLMYMNSVFESGNFGDKPFRNIILDKVNLQFRAEDIDVADIQLFVDNAEEYYKSFIVRKYHDKWARDNKVGEFLNDMKETWIVYGGVITKKEKDAVPRVVPFNTVAFVDQTDIVSGAICEKHFYTPDQLSEYDGKWDNIDLVIALATQRNDDKEVGKNNIQQETPTQYIEVYELHGVFPESWLVDGGNPLKYTRQAWVVTYYKDNSGKKNGVVLYKGKESKSPYKVSVRDKIVGRGLGRGAVEELFEPQIWVNYNEILQKEMLDYASKVLLQTADPAYTTSNKTKNPKNGSIFVTEEGKPISQIQITPVNVQFFESKLKNWEDVATRVSASFETISGEQTKSGTPFRLGLLQNQEAHSLHLYRKEKLGMFVQEIYRDWVIPHFAQSLSSGTKFLSELTLDEMNAIYDQVMTAEVNEYIKEKLFNLDVPDQQKIQQIQEITRKNFYAGGNKKFIEIFKDEMKELPLDIEIVITGENKNNAFVAEKLSAIFSNIVQNPAILSNPLMAKLFNEILEASGVSPTSFMSLYQPEKAGQVPMAEQSVAPVASPPQVLPNQQIAQ